ncbi:unnamed protein product [Sphenostylis stenocarpa]|uniref:Uncharacterized protein n=1 Tax=Sphenostylis stenocarpa TaxID=92480 RepID=A0AA86VJI6_9FABA|nr:unnamed protein product [Sphenostylis stenocarpa]
MLHLDSSCLRQVRFSLRKSKKDDNGGGYDKDIRRVHGSVDEGQRAPPSTPWHKFWWSQEEPSFCCLNLLRFNFFYGLLLITVVRIETLFSSFHVLEDKIFVYCIINWFCEDTEELQKNWQYKVRHGKQIGSVEEVRGTILHGLIVKTETRIREHDA